MPVAALVFQVSFLRRIHLSFKEQKHCSPGGRATRAHWVVVFVFVTTDIWVVVTNKMLINHAYYSLIAK